MNQKQFGIVIGAIFGAALLVVVGVAAVYVVADSRRVAEKNREEREISAAVKKAQEEFKKKVGVKPAPTSLEFDRSRIGVPAKKKPAK